MTHLHQVWISLHKLWLYGTFPPLWYSGTNSAQMFIFPPNHGQSIVYQLICSWSSKNFRGICQSLATISPAFAMVSSFQAVDSCPLLESSSRSSHSFLYLLNHSKICVLDRASFPYTTSRILSVYVAAFPVKLDVCLPLHDNTKKQLMCEAATGELSEAELSFH